MGRRRDWSTAGTRSSCGYDPDDLEHYNPRVVHVDADNEILQIDREVATLLAPTAA